jgi:hypothetical protein
MNIPGFEQTMNLLNRIATDFSVSAERAQPFRIRTTHPSDDSGVALLSRHFESQDTVDEAEAMRKYGIGRLSARVFDLNKWYAQHGMNRKIVCVKKEVIKVNGRKAWVTDYYKLEVTV